MTTSQNCDLKNLDDATEKLLSLTIHQNNVKANEKSNKRDAISFTEALTLTKHGKFNYFLIFVSGMIIGNSVLETAAIGFILPIAQCDLLLSNADKGILSAIGFAGVIVSSHLWGFLADTKGRRKVILPTLLAAFLVTLLSSFANKFWLLVILRFINGFLVSSGSATIFAYLGEFHTDKTRSRAIMGSSLISALCLLLMPLIAFLVINQDWTLQIAFLGINFKPWRLFIIACGIPGFLCGIAMYFLPESPKFLLSIGKEDKAIEVLRKMLRWNGSKSELQISQIISEMDINRSTVLLSNSNANPNCLVIFMQTMWNQTAPLFNKKYLRITLIVCTIQFWLYVVTNGLYMWFPHIINSIAEFMKEHPGQDKTICQIVYDKHDEIYKTDGSMECIVQLEDSTYIYSLIMGIMYAAAFAFISVIINRLGKIKILISIMIFCIICGITAVLTSNLQISSYLFVLFFMLGVGINILGAVTVELYPTNLRAMAICISFMIGRLGSVAGAYVVGILLEHSCELTFYISGSAIAVCVFLSLFIPLKKFQTE